MKTDRLEVVLGVLRADRRAHAHDREEIVHLDGGTSQSHRHSGEFVIVDENFTEWLLLFSLLAWMLLTVWQVTWPRHRNNGQIVE